MSQLSIPQAYELALRHHRAGNVQEAEHLYRQILQVQPRHPGVLNHLGIIAHQQGKNDFALDLIRQALAVVPNYPEAYDNLGNVLKSKGLLDQAITAYRSAIVLMPRSAMTRNNLGLALLQGGQLNQAISAFREAIAVDPAYANAHCNLSNALWSNRQLDEALAAARTAVALNPRQAQGFGNLGIALRSTGHFVEAIVAFRQAISLDPAYPDSHLHLSLLLLMQGDFAEVWDQYEWRWQCHSYAFMRRNFEKPQWDGSPLGTQILLIHTEQGLGDAIQFSRYLTMITQLAGNLGAAQIIFEVQPELVRLFQTFASQCTVVSRGEPLPAFDLHYPLLSLPRIFKTTLESIPKEMPYLFADHNLVEAWRSKLDRTDSRMKVGLVWAGNPHHENDWSRSIPMAHLAPLGTLDKAVFYSLQKSGPDRPADHTFGELKLISLSSELHDMADTAAAICSMDLVITVDTSVAHLTGALGRPVWVLLPFVPDWRWLTDREDSPWYSSMRLFRQSVRGDWDSVINRVVAALRDRANLAV